jgi:two-component system cell cycle sensor histidine kinase/response regulator CckA
VNDAAYRVLFEGSPRPMMISDRDSGALVAANAAAAAVFGYAVSELVGLPYAALRDEAGIPRARDGSMIEAELVSNPIELEGRACVLTFIYDIRPNEAVARRFALMGEHATEGVTLTDSLGITRYVSKSVERILGLAPGDVIGTRGLGRVHPEDLRKLTLPAPGATVTSVQRTMHADGKWRWLESVTTNLHDDPAVRGFVANFRDVTERVEASERLRRSEANFRSLIERLPITTLVHRGGKFIYVNPAAVAMLGWDRPEDLIGRGALEFVVAEDRAVLRTSMLETVKTGASATVEARMVRRDGTIVSVEGKSVLLDYDGEPTHVVLANDITERRAMFTRMAVADRMLSVGTLAAGVAHEINNPLAYISANLQILASELPKVLYGEGVPRFAPGELESVLADAQEGAHRVSVIVRDMLTLARPEDNATGPVDVVEVLTSSIKMTHNEIRHRARLVQAYGDVPPVEANPSRLGQVFLNLLVNAAHAIEDGHVEANEVSVRVHADDSRVYIEIADTGSGIAPNVLPRIFDPFFTTKPAGVGVGLGLSICDRIIEAFGGTITVTSRLGFGSTFRVALPTTKKAAAQPPKALEVPAQPPSRILMIDDEAAVGRAIRLLLAPDHEVINVTRALEGLAKLELGEVFDLILCDVMMPEMSGIELYGELRTRFPAYTQRVVFMTGGAFTPQAREALEELGVPRLEKPFSENVLREAIARVSSTLAAPRARPMP